MNQYFRSAFSPLEIIAAIVILAVVSTATVATLSPLQQRSEKRRESQDLATLHAMSETFFLENDRFPTGIDDLIEVGFFPNQTKADRERIVYWRRFRTDGFGRWFANAANPQ